MLDRKHPIALYATLFYTALACITTYPLVRRLWSTVPHDLGDPLLSVGILWWSAHVAPFTERWWNGFAFWPASGFVAYSDPRVGESVIASPLQWLGCSPVTAYNLTLLATYPLCALSAHWLGFVLTKRHDAAAIGGLAYGFCPFRVGHLPHLELLAGFGMPAALAALHRYRETRRPRWLAAFATALVVQGLCSSYYLLFFSVLLGLWLLWFTRRDDVRALPGIVLAGAAALVLLLPLAIGYSRIHARYGFNRRFDEILRLSADVTSFFTAHPLVMLWGWTAKWAKPEGELFPGATIASLAIVGIVLAWRRRPPIDWLDRRSRWLLVAAGAAAALAWCGWAYAPWRITALGIRISSDSPFKPATVALLAILVWIGASSPFRAAYARRSPFAFYVVAAGVLFICSLGPKPTFAGHQFLYEPPYAWLMELPAFSSVRVPARFGLPAMLTLAIAGALAFDRFPLRPAVRRLLAIALLIGVAADGWMSGLPLPALPDVWPAPRAAGFDAVVELPLGDLFGDFAAIYRATRHRRPIVNGTSGFEPAHYFTLRTALEEKDPAAFDGLPPNARVLAVVDKHDVAHHDWDRFLVANPRVTRLLPDERWLFYAISPTPPPALPCHGDPAPIAAITDEQGNSALAALTDGSPHTWWATPHPQRAGDNLVLDLGRTVRPCSITIAVGEFASSYVRKLIVETSVDGTAWTVVASRRMAGAVMAAALEDPIRVAVSIPLAPSAARLVRLRADETHPTIAWLVTDVAVSAARDVDRGRLPDGTGRRPGVQPRDGSGAEDLSPTTIGRVRTSDAR